MAIKNLALIIAILFTAAWNLSVEPAFGNYAFNLVIFFSLLYVLKGGYYYLAWALGLGILLDYFSAGPPGFNTSLLLIFCLSIRRLAVSFPHDNVMKFFSMSAAGVLLYAAFTWLLAFIYKLSGLVSYHTLFGGVSLLPLIWQILIVFCLLLGVKFYQTIKGNRYNHNVTSL